MGEVEFNLGEKIRKFRSERNLTIKDVAESTGFSTALISRIEHNRVSPPIATLYRIGQTLNVRLRDFFEEEPIKEDIWVVRVKDKPKAYRDGSKYGYLYEALAHDPQLREFEPLLVTLLPEDRDRAQAFSHLGYEFLFVLKGKMDFRYGKKNYLLGAGDSLFFTARVSHRGVCRGETPVKALSIRFLAPEAAP